MADEIDAGRLVAEIVLETKQARENAEEFSDVTLNYIQSSLENLGITGQKATDMIQKGFTNLVKQNSFNVGEVQQYTSALEDLASKIENCETRKRAYIKVNDTDGIERSSQAIEKLNQMYTSIQSQLDGYIAKMVKVAQTENQINELAGISIPDVVTEKVTLNAQSYADTIQYIREVLTELGITGNKADDIISACFKDVSGLKKYQNELEVLSSKIEMAQKQYQELAKTKNTAEKQGNLSQVDKLTNAMEKQAVTVKSLESRFDSTYSQMDSAIKKTVSNYEKQAVAAQKATQKQSELDKQFSKKQSVRNFAGSVNLATTSLRTLNSTVPDTIDGIGEIITQINAAKQAMTTGASAPIAWGTAIVAGIGVVASLIINEAKKVQQAEEEARQKAAEAAEEAKSAREGLSDLSDEYVSLKTKLDMANLSHSDEIEIKSNLLDLQKELIEKYGEEAKSINIVSGSLSEQRKEIKKLAKEKADQYLLENESSYDNAQKKLKETSTMYSVSRAASAGVGIAGWDQTIYNKLVDEDVKKLIEEKFAGSIVDLPGQELKITLNDEEAKDKLEELYREIKNLKGEDSPDLAVLSKTLDWYKSEKEEKIKEYKAITDEYEKQQEIFKNSGEENKSFFETLNDIMSNSIDKVEGYSNAMSDLSSAYQSVNSGEKLSADNLSQLMEKYPELADYVNQTGDFTLANGEKIKESFENQKKALISTLEDEKKELEKKSNTYAGMSVFREEQNQIKNRISEINAEIAIYKNGMSDIQDSIDTYTNKMSNLSSVYKTVSAGGQLNSDTLQSLMEEYPELANYVSQTGDLTLANGEKIKEVYEKERQELIKKLTAKKQELELEQKDSDKKGEIAKQLAQINAELEIYTNTKIDNVDWSSTASEIKSLASAYQTLNEGKQLDVDTMIQLIDKYPAVASAMANEGKLGKEQANVFKQLFEAKKNDYILTQKRTIANLQASADETKGVIKNIQSQIEAYKNLNQLKGVFSVISYAMTTSLSDTLAKNQQEYNRIQQNIKQAEARIKAIKNININTYGTSGSGGFSDSNKALANELKRLEHKKALGQLTSKQEYNWLVRINNKYRKNSDEQMDMEKRLYNAKKQMRADEEAANTKALQEAYKRIENKKSLGKMTSQQELRQLEQIRQKYKMTADERMELEIKIYNLKKSLKDEEISSINTLADVVTEALKEKYEQQRKIEEERINDSIKNWQDWEDKTVEAIQGEINALDELADKQESENKRQEYENKRQQTELQLAYEKDDYNRTQLQKELARLDKEEAERLAEEQREAKKKVLEGRIEAVKGQSQATQERLNKELDKLGERYEKLTDSFSLKAQAQKIIINSTQKDIVNLIKSYAPEYELAGNTVGDALYNGMKSKTNNIISYIEGIVKKFEAYQRRVANTANAAADRFWANQNSQANPKPSSSPKTVTVQQTVNFNKPVESPVETRRQLDRTNQALAKQISSEI